MSVLQKVIGAVLRPRVRGRARGRGYEDMVRRLQESGKQVEERFLAAQDSAGNREAMNHMVGIERWAQSRLKVALGDPFEPDSYRGYRLRDDASLEELQQAFIETRQRSIDLTRELEQAGVDPDKKVQHNDLGELTVIEWLAYIEDHAWRERIRVRPA